ncbi:flagellar hook-basal body protein [Bacillus sp. FJAT-45066]|uniref:flagellar hook-basal body protein n=1 Tax=Bacillus sp. FJAT-45066 TaxID=2011010 RepID=UPI000BB940E3|nr:flagellar hook-basal body protein [Bacillus sp. FJAT-45066]
MLRGLYTATSGMMSQQRKMETLSNNMANANTPGFKADQTALRSFPELLMHRMGQQNIPTQKPMNLNTLTPIGGLNTGVYLQETLPSFIQGDPQQTSVNTDMMILQQAGEPGAVFFTVEHPDGTPRYTRNGNFALDAQGFLTTNSGQYVLDTNNNRIQVPTREFTLLPNGTLQIEGTPVATLGLAYAQNPSDLIKEGSGVFRLPADAAIQALPAANINFQVLQGHLERSNVDTGLTMSDMMSAFRAFEANQKIIQAYDQTMQKAANEIGRIN